MRHLRFVAVCLVITVCGCSNLDINQETGETAANDSDANALSLPFEKFTLENGMDVIFHVDRSDPVVAIDLAVHVGSGREVTGRTGFAHLFEHLLFLDSENLGYGGLDQMNTRIGGDGTNGFTTNDMTQYFQAVPKDALEKIIWAEADKIGWFINTVSQDVVDNEKQVVKNEKRQRVDNQPYGHNLYIIAKAMYPEGHPYNWQVIGSLEDVEAATLQDVKDFFARWYVPNNVTVTIAGDFDIAQARAWVEKYFGEIPGSDPLPEYQAAAASLERSVNFMHEDNFATVPQLTLAWPAVAQYHPDAYALDVLLSYLTEGKRAPLNAVMIDEDKVTSTLFAFNYTKELAGEIYLGIRANQGEDIDGLMPSLEKALARFEAEGISQADLDRIKAGTEVAFYNNVQSALGKAIQLGEYNVFTGDPGFISTDIARLQAVTTADVMRVYRDYIKDQPRVAVSFVPKGQVELALADATVASVVEEQIVAGEGAPPNFDPAARVLEQRTPSAFDRSIEPPFGDAYTLPVETTWRTALDNGLRIVGLASDETPLVQFSLRFDAGQVRSSVDKSGNAALVADMLSKGTESLTTAEFEDAVKSLGATIDVYSGDWTTVISGVTLKRNFDATMALVVDMVNSPRWDSEEFDLLKARVVQEITQAEGNPNAIAAREAAKLRYPEDNVLHYAGYGPKASVEATTIDDLKAFHRQFYRWDSAVLNIVGDYRKADVVAALGQQPERNPARRDPGNVGALLPVESAGIYFYDVPGAKQSILRAARPAMSVRDDDYLVADFVNFSLGGIYTSQLNTTLRVEKGYTYGIRSGFSATDDRGQFSVRTSVRSNVTRESLALIRDIVSGYGDSFDAASLEVAKSAVLRGQALSNETLNDKLRRISFLSRYEFSDNFFERQAAAIDAMDLDAFRTFTARYMTPDRMRYLVVGDAESQAGRLSDLGLGEVTLLVPPAASDTTQSGAE